MTATFTVVAYLTLVAAVAVGQWIYRQTTGTLMQEWRNKW